MFKPFSLFVGLRYIRAKKRSLAVSFISLMSMLGIALGVLVLIATMSVMNGFEKELKQRILGMVPHVSLYNPFGSMTDWQAIKTEAEQHPKVQAAAPFIRTQGMLRARGSSKFILVQGILPELQEKVSIVNNFMQSGQLADLQQGEFGIVLGESLAHQLGLYHLGDKVSLIVLQGSSVSPIGVIPPSKRFTLVGTFKVGAELDSNLAYIHMADAAKLTRMQDAVSGVRLLADDVMDAPWVAQQIRESFSHPLQVQDWRLTHGNLFSAIQTEKRMVGLLLVFIVGVAAFNILSSLVMIVNAKHGAIAILRTMGAKPLQIMTIFIVQGTAIGMIGTVLGVIGGVALSLNIPDIVQWIEAMFEIQFLPPDIYHINYFPSDLRWGDVSFIAAVAFGLSFIATILPSFIAGRINPAEALRYE